MKTLRMKPEYFDLLLQGPIVKSTTIRKGRNPKQVRPGDHVEVRCAKTHQAVECQVTNAILRELQQLTDLDAHADGFACAEDLQDALRKLNRDLEDEDTVTIIGLQMVGAVRDTRFETFSDDELEAMSGGLGWAGALRELVRRKRDVARRKPEVQG